MLVPTSASTAVMLEYPDWVGSLLELAFPALLLLGVYCAWEMALSAILGKPPARSRWVVLGVSVLLVVCGILAETLLTTVFAYNGDAQTYWGYVVSGWLYLAVMPCVVVLAAYRIDDARGTAPFIGIPQVGWLVTGGLAAAFYGAAASWVFGGSLYAAAYVTPLVAVGFAMGTAAIGALAIAAELRWSRRPAVSELDRA